MVNQIRLTEAALGTVTYEMIPKKLKSRQFARSLYAVQDIVPGEPFTPENVRSIRPGFGLPPKQSSTLYGRESSVEWKKGQPLTGTAIQN